MTNDKNIVVLGAGYAGVQAAKKLAKKYKKADNVKITIIDKNPFHTLMTELHEVAGGRVEPQSVKVDLSKIFNRTKVSIITDYIEKVETEEMVVYTTNGKYQYDYLIVALGSEPAFFGVPGVKDNGFTLWSFEDAIRIRTHIEKTFQKAAKERDEERRKALLTFVVAGSGFTGIEMAGELLEWKSKLAKEYKVEEKEVKVMVVEALGTILNMLDEGQAKKAENYMINHGMDILKNSPIVNVEKDKIQLKSGQEIKTGTLIWTCGIQGNNDVNEYGLELGRGNRVKANEYMEAENAENVYVVGDLTCFEETPGRLTPQIVEAAEQTAMTAVNNIIANMENKEKVKFKSNYHGFMVSIGGRYCVANLSGMKLSGFFAMVMKHIINMIYLFGIGGFYLIWRYLNHEFFHIKDKRTIMRGHLSSYGNRLWLLPLRLFMGFTWIFEGGKKFFGENTWKEGISSVSNWDKLFNGIGSDSWIRDGNVKLPFDWLYTAANSGASQQAGEVATQNMPTPILKEMPSLFKSMMEFMIPNAEVAIWFQRIVVLTEIAIGLCLLAGLFTWIVSAVSAFMVVNFILSAMAGWEVVWFFFGAIALMGGAGRVFGLDYFVMPWLGKILGRWYYGEEKAIYGMEK